MKTAPSFLILLAASALFLGACVPAEDITSMDLRIRNLDSRVVKLDEAVKRIDGGGTEKSPLEAIREKQADLGDAVDQVNADLLELKARMEEDRHSYQNMQQDNDKARAELQRKIDALSEQFVVLADQLRQTAARLDAMGERSQAAISQAQQAAAEAEAARKAAEEAGKKAAARAAAQKRTSKGPKKIVPAKTKTAPGKKKPAAATATGGATGPGREIYDKALGLFRKGKFNEAYQEFDRYLKKYPTGKMAPNARFWLGDCYYSQQEYELAILEYQKVIADFPAHPKAPAALLKQGLAFEKLKDKDTARIVYKKVVDDYPKSDQAATAKSRLKALGKK